MNELQINQVWRTKSGRLGIIVDSTINGEKALLWYDEVTRELTVSEIYERLDYVSDFTPTDVFMIWFGINA